MKVVGRAFNIYASTRYWLALVSGFLRGGHAGR